MPPSACSKRPTRRLSAPVNEPFSWPNSSLSSSVSASGAQCSATNGAFARGLSAWMARASSPLPVPLSPVMSTVARDAATCRADAIDLLHRRARADEALQALARRARAAGGAGSRPRRAASRRSSARSMATSERVEVDRLGQVVGGARRASRATADETSPNAVATMTGSSRILLAQLARAARCRPSRGIFRSVTTTSGGCSAAMASALGAVLRGVDVVALLREELLEPGARARLVVDDQDAGLGSLVRARCRHGVS